jgi:tetratricopeptide (TPR) repeat protein
MRCVFIAAGLLAMPLLWSPPARAQGGSSEQDKEAQAKVMYNNGVTLYEEGSYEAAIVAFRKAYELSGRHALLYNIANAQERLGRTQDAIDTLNTYRAYAMPDEAESLERRLRAMERRVEEERRIAKAKADAEAAAATNANPNPQPTPTPTPPPERQGVGAGSLVLYVTGAVGISAGALFGVNAMGARDDAMAFCSEGGGTLYCSPEADEHLARDRRNSLASDISFGIGAAALIGGVVTTFIDVSGPFGPAVQLQVGPRSVGVGGVF